MSGACMLGFTHAKARIAVSLLLLPVSTSAKAQAPAGWNQQPALGSDLPSGTAWYGAGLWGGGNHAGPAPLVDGLGLGNAYTGLGPQMEGGLNLGNWSLAMKVLGNGDSSDSSPKAMVYQWHLLRQKPGGWKVGLEAEPLVWGYGNLGGYLLGESARPFPRFIVESPYRHLSLGGWSLGRWGFQTFTGRLESDRTVTPLSQVPLIAAGQVRAFGEPQAPFLSGYRLQAKALDEKVEFYLNWTVLWGGTRNGIPMTQGYSWKDYLTAMTGTKDVLSQNGINFNDPNHPMEVPVSAARSSTNFDLGMRWQLDWLSRLTSTEKAWFYVSRGSKGVLIQWSHLAKKPVYYLQQDLQSVAKDVASLNFSRLWNKKDSYVLPNLIVPNDTMGFMLQWPGVRLAIEHHDTVNPAGVTYRSFIQGDYGAGYYTHGDALGEALGGEANTSDLRLEADFGPRLTTTTWVLAGLRYFRDGLDLWTAQHPALSPTPDNFIGLQQRVDWKFGPGASFNLGASWQRHSALSNVPGEVSNGFRWFAGLSYRWAKGI